jgi:predicted dehydrogenase
MSENFLIVSLGSIGRRHLNNLRRLRPDAQIGVLRLRSDISNQDVPDGADVQFNTIEDAIAFRPLAAVIASPASTHLQVAASLVAAGIPILMEKPIADTCKGLGALIEEGAKRNVPIMTGYNLRFLPSLKEARRLLESGVIGRVLGARAEVGQYLPDWRPASRYQEAVSAQHALGGGALLELSHEIDYLYWIFGLPDRVMARGGRYSDLEIDVEDMANICLEYESPRRLVNIHLDFLQRSPTRSCKFIGENGTIIWNGITDSLDLFRAESGVWERIDGFVQSDRNQMYLDELSHFFDCLGGRQKLIVDGVQGYDVLAIVDAAKASIESNSTVKVEGYARR